MEITYNLLFVTEICLHSEQHLMSFNNNSSWELNRMMTIPIDLNSITVSDLVFKIESNSVLAYWIKEISTQNVESDYPDSSNTSTNNTNNNTSHNNTNNTTNNNTSNTTTNNNIHPVSEIISSNNAMISLNNSIYQVEELNSVCKTQFNNSDRFSHLPICMYTNTCVICTEQFEDGQLLVPLPCKHLFHKQCIMTWLTSSKIAQCPLCREDAESTYL